MLIRFSRLALVIGFDADCMSIYNTQLSIIYFFLSPCHNQRQDCVQEFFSVKRMMKILPRGNWLQFSHVLLLKKNRMHIRNLQNVAKTTLLNPSDEHIFVDAMFIHGKLEHQQNLHKNAMLWIKCEKIVENQTRM